MARRIKYDPRGIAHIYQRGYRMSVIFYSVKDILVFYTLLYVMKERHHVKVIGLVLMFNHYHMLLQADSQSTISAFMREFETAYSKAFCKDGGIAGPVSEPGYGLSNKIGDKKMRDATAYLYNNPVEKQLCVRIEEYRWNFLAYAVCDNPFSERLIVREASTRMKKALDEVNFLFKSQRSISYTFLEKWFGCLDRKEIQQLTDYIIAKYKVADYDSSIKLYGSYETMLTAINSNTGSEHDIHEDYSEKSYQLYTKAVNCLIKDFKFSKAKDALRLEEQKRKHLCRALVRQCHCSRFIAETLLHLYAPPQKRSSGHKAGIT